VGHQVLVDQIIYAKQFRDFLHLAAASLSTLCPLNLLNPNGFFWVLSFSYGHGLNQAGQWTVVIQNAMLRSPLLLTSQRRTAEVATPNARQRAYGLAQGKSYNHVLPSTSTIFSEPRVYRPARSSFFLRSEAMRPEMTGLCHDPPTRCGRRAASPSLASKCAICTLNR
jgi:hypothetical protein